MSRNAKKTLGSRGSAPDPAGGAYSAPQAGCPSQELHPAQGLSGIGHRLSLPPNFQTPSS